MSARFDPQRWTQIERVFNAALELNPTERPEFVREECTDDNELCDEVLSLLEISGEADRFLVTPVSDAVREVAARAQKSRLEPGGRINHYEVVSKIAAGGMGEVYLAIDTTLAVWFMRVCWRVTPGTVAPLM